MRNLTRDMAFGAGPAAGDGRRRELILLFAALGAILLLRLLGIGFASIDLHYEEARQWFLSLGLAGSVWNNPPLPIWLTGLATNLCGDGAVCLRVPSALVSVAGAGLAYGAALQLYDRRTAVLAAIAYATLPVISAFAMVAIPEALLGFFAAAAIWALAVHFDRPTPLTGLAVGLAFGLGLLTDDGMGWLAACTLLYLAMVAQARFALKAPGTWLAIVIALAMVAPRLLTNVGTEIADLGNFFRTGGRLLGHLDPDEALAFILLQFLLFGPVFLFVFLRSVVARYNIVPRNPADLFLLYHAVPIFAAILVLSFFRQGTSHYTLPAYPAAVIFVTALLLRHGYRRLFFGSIALHAVIMTAIVGVAIFAGRTAEPPGLNRLLGWEDFAEGLSRAASVSDVNTVVLRSGDQVYEALYYLRGRPLEIRAFRPRGRQPVDDVDRQRSWAYGDSETVLLATGQDPSTFGIPLDAIDKIGEFPVQSYLSSSGVFSLYRINPPADGVLGP